jgi:UDP-glucose 4-epimerase
VEEVVGKKAIVEFQPARKFDAPHIVLDSSLARSKLNWQPRMKLAKGLALTWSWISSTIKA